MEGENEETKLAPTNHHQKFFSYLQKVTIFFRKCQYVPVAILLVSAIQIIVFVSSTKKLQKLFRFEPSKMHQLYRFVTYMFLHDDWIHLFLNIFLQILFALFLEARHERSRVLCLYFLGGITAVLGASCFHPDLIIGASGGVYALLISHLADILMNFENMRYKVYRCVCILNIIIFDIIYNVIHFKIKRDPVISWETHVVGGASGFFLGLVLFKKEESLAKARKLGLFWLGSLLYCVLLILLVFTATQIKKCTPSDSRNTYVYVC